MRKKSSTIITSSKTSYPVSNVNSNRVSRYNSNCVSTYNSVKKNG